MEMEFLVSGPPALTGLWLLDAISAVDLCASPVPAEARLGLDPWLAQSSAQGWGLSSKITPTTLSKIFLQREDGGEPESMLVSGKLSHLSLVKASLSKVIIAR